MADDIEVADVEVWASGLEEVRARIGCRFSRSEPRHRVLATHYTGAFWASYRPSPKAICAR